MGHIEQQRGAHGVAFVLRGKHALRDVTASTWFSPGVVAGPPLHRQRNEQHGNPGVGVGQVGEHGQFGLHVGVAQQTFQAAHLGQAQDPGGGPNRPDHRQDELHEIGEDHRAQPPEHAVGQGDAACHQQGEPAGPSQQNATELDGGQTDGRHDQHVEHQAEVQGPEAPPETRRDVHRISIRKN